MTDYPRVQPDSPMYALLEEYKIAGVWCCDSADHNDDDGCSNSGCVKYRGARD